VFPSKQNQLLGKSWRGVCGLWGRMTGNGQILPPLLKGRSGEQADVGARGAWALDSPALHHRPAQPGEPSCAREATGGIWRVPSAIAPLGKGGGGLIAWSERA
jgi:hypothetical protein